MIWIHLIQPILAMQHQEGGQSITPPPSNDTRISLLCTPFGTCEPCPADSVRFALLSYEIKLTQNPVLHITHLDKRTFLPTFRKSPSYALYKFYHNRTTLARTNPTTPPIQGSRRPSQCTTSRWRDTGMGVLWTYLSERTS